GRQPPRPRGANRARSRGRERERRVPRCPGAGAEVLRHHRLRRREWCAAGGADHQGGQRTRAHTPPTAPALGPARPKTSWVADRMGVCRAHLTRDRRAAGYKPGTWVTLYAGNMGDTCAVGPRRTTVHGQRRLVDALVGDGGGGATGSVSARLSV